MKREVATEVTTEQDGRSARWNTHRAARRAELVEGARRVIHSQGADASMDDIADAIGTSKSIIYRYFTDKEGLRQAVASRVVSDLHDELVRAAANARTPVGGLRAMVRVYLEMIEQSPRIYWYVSRASMGMADGHGATSHGDSPEQPLSAYLDSVIDVVARPYFELTGVKPEMAAAWAAGAVGYVRGAGEWWLARREDGTATLSRKQLADHVADWLWQGPLGVLPKDAEPHRHHGEMIDMHHANNPLKKR